MGILRHFLFSDCFRVFSDCFRVFFRFYFPECFPIVSEYSLDFISQIIFPIIFRKLKPEFRLESSEIPADHFLPPKIPLVPPSSLPLVGSGWLTIFPSRPSFCFACFTVRLYLPLVDSSNAHTPTCGFYPSLRSAYRHFHLTLSY